MSLKLHHRHLHGHSHTGVGAALALALALPRSEGVEVEGLKVGRATGLVAAWARAPALLALARRSVAPRAKAPGVEKPSHPEPECSGGSPPADTSTGEEPCRSGPWPSHLGSEPEPRRRPSSTDLPPPRQEHNGSGPQSFQKDAVPPLPLTSMHEFSKAQT